ncbi:hypothetical protein TPAR_03668 [Tolypocladium paradoxum]|uniref:Uncharacterized protein n=1 Tax=Tolypocladium paradoxum TaxID=94208 RepID=A0A2S4L148_9HYPO|nr:hypothetical protein TPAR_03668 [Tolypocladium paradoxum]
MAPPPTPPHPGRRVATSQSKPTHHSIRSKGMSWGSSTGHVTLREGKVNPPHGSDAEGPNPLDFVVLHHTYATSRIGSCDFDHDGPRVPTFPAPVVSQPTRAPACMLLASPALK